MTVAPEELDLRIRSARLHAQRFGSPSAPLVIGLHGVSLNMKAFDFLGERLGEELQLVAFDLRGRGRSEVTAPGTYGWDNHARDAFAVADELGFERFVLVGQSMGGSVAMKAAELDAGRLDAVVLVDIAGRVDRGAGDVAASIVDELGVTHASLEELLAAVRARGLIDPWTDHWERCHRYGAIQVDGGWRARVDLAAIAEDRAYGATQHVYERWRHLAMPTLLLRATREMRPGTGHVIPADDVIAFRRDVPHASIVEVDANHLTVNTHPDTPRAIAAFLG